MGLRSRSAAGQLRRRYHVQLTEPSQCARELLAGRADLGLIPIAALTPELRIVPGCTIASLARVRSIQLIVKQPLALQASPERRRRHRLTQLRRLRRDPLPALPPHAAQRSSRRGRVPRHARRGRRRPAHRRPRPARPRSSAPRSKAQAGPCPGTTSPSFGASTPACPGSPPSGPSVPKPCRHAARQQLTDDLTALPRPRPQPHRRPRPRVDAADRTPTRDHPHLPDPEHPLPPRHELPAGHPDLPRTCRGRRHPRATPRSSVTSL